MDGDSVNGHDSRRRRGWRQRLLRKGFQPESGRKSKHQSSRPTTHGSIHLRHAPRRGLGQTGQMPQVWHGPGREKVTGNIGVEPPLRISTIGSLGALKSILALLLLGTWFPCTVRCSLEMMAMDKPPACCSEVGGKSSPQPADSDHCVCSWMKSGGYAFSKCALSVTAQDVVTILSILSPLGEDSLTDPALPKPNYSPPGLATFWQFSFRTALPPRAPSTAS